jgi:hypothetical protein
MMTLMLLQPIKLRLQLTAQTLTRKGCLLTLRTFARSSIVEKQ